MKLASKISLSIFMVAMLGTAAACLGFYLLTRRGMEQEIRAHLESVTQSRAEHVETYLAMLQISVGQLSKSVVLETLLKTPGAGFDRPGGEFETAMTRLRRTREANPSISEFLLLDKTGKVIAATGEKDIGADKSTDTIFLGAQEKIYLKDVYYSEEFREPLLAVSAPITDSRTGEFLGVLAARVKLGDLSAICAERTGLGASGEIYILNKYGFAITPTLFRQDAALKLKVDTQNARLARLHTNREHVVIDRTGVFPDYRGVPVLGTHACIPSMQWAVLAEIDAREALAPLATILRVLIILLLAIPLIAWLTGILVARTMTRALAKLHQGTEIIGAGDLDYKVGTGARDEVGQLSRAFDAMTEHLKDTTTSVENLNREIAERKLAEEKLRERTAELFDREEDLAITLRSIGDALIATDAEGRVTRINPVAEQLTGWTMAEATGRPLADVFRIINAQTRAPVENPIARVLASGLVVGLANHTALIARDGTARQIADSAAPIRDANGRIRGVVLVFHDVTAEYHIKEALQKKTEELEGFFNIALDLLCIADLEGNFLKVNKAWEDVLGYPATELERSKFLDFVHPEDMQATLDAMARLGEGKRVLNFTNRYRHKDGSYRFIEWRSTPQGNLIYAAARDITERKLTEDKIRQAKEDWERTFDSVPDSICLIDATHTITRINRAMANLLGIKPEEAIGRHCYACLHHTDCPHEFCPYEKLFQDGTDHQAEIMEEHLGKWLHITVSPLRNAKGAVIGTVHIARDITERKRAEEALIQAKTDLDKAYRQLQESFKLESKLAVEARAASAAKSQFVANISHEIRTPLNGIIGICELLLGTRMSPEQKEYAQLIDSSAESLLNIINATLDFSKIDAGKMELEHINFNLRSIFEDIIGVLAVNAARKKIELIGFIEPATPLNLTGDPGRLRQVLFNLIGNAVKFTSTGEIDVTVAPVEEEQASQPRGEKGSLVPSVLLRFSVRDTGIGIPPDKIDLLFTAFTQVDDSYTRKFGGTGLGLAIAKGLVEQMGGRIGVESVPGQGSSFWFTVPFEKQQPETTRSFEPDAYFGGQRILIVDDNETNRTILTMQLRAWGIITETAASGAEALEKLRQAEEEDPFWAVITDERMSEMDGLALAAKIKAEPEFQQIPVILMTSMTLPAELYAEHKHLLAGIILKPVRQSHLFYSLLTALSGEQKDEFSEMQAAVAEQSIFQTGLRILVVEDNITNQKVICGILQKMGHTVIAVANGKEALQALALVPYHLVLMDIQMPEMDGFEATRRIREMEAEWSKASVSRRSALAETEDQRSAGSGSSQPSTPRNAGQAINLITLRAGHQPFHPIPILALTAHTLEGDREKCLAAGMNGYIPKPVTTKSLANALADIIATSGIKAAVMEKPPRPEPGSAVFDENSFSERLMNNKELMRETIGIFLEDTPARIRDLMQKVKEHDRKSVAMIAHTLKGSSANVSGQQLQAAAAKIETACNADDWRDAEALAAKLNKHFAALEQAMREFVKTIQ